MEPPDIGFSYELTVGPLICRVCTYGIDFEDHPKHIKIHIPSPMYMHIECFEKLGWSITYFTLNYKPPEETEVH